MISVSSCIPVYVVSCVVMFLCWGIVMLLRGAVFTIEASPAPAPIFRGSYALALPLSGPGPDLAHIIRPGLNGHQFSSGVSRWRWGGHLILTGPVGMFVTIEGRCYCVHSTLHIIGLHGARGWVLPAWQDSVDNIRSSHSVTLANRFIDIHAMKIGHKHK